MQNNVTTARQPLRLSEQVSILTLQILGLITRDGQGQFTATEKFERLKIACEKHKHNIPITESEFALIAECDTIINYE